MENYGGENKILFEEFFNSLEKIAIDLEFNDVDNGQSMTEDRGPVDRACTEVHRRRKELQWSIAQRKQYRQITVNRPTRVQY